MLYSLIYISKAVRPLTTAELTILLEQSRSHNQAADITGMLLYIQRSDGSQAGRFMQVIEGEKPGIQSLFEKIKTDGRHHEVLLVSEDDISHRSFETWSMGFKTINASEFALPGYLDLANESMLHRKLGGISKPMNYLKSFYQISQERQF